MIIELKIELSNNKFLFSAWEIPNQTWNDKQIQINLFIDNISKTNEIKIIKNLSENTLELNIIGKPYNFYDAQSSISSYLSTIQDTVELSGY